VVRRQRVTTSSSSRLISSDPITQWVKPWPPRNFIPIIGQSQSRSVLLFKKGWRPVESYQCTGWLSCDQLCYITSHQIISDFIWFCGIISNKTGWYLVLWDPMLWHPFSHHRSGRCLRVPPVLGCQVHHLLVLQHVIHTWARHIQSLDHSFIHSFIHACSSPFIILFIQSCMHAVIHSIVHSFIHQIIH
jgi:hypothetical protein